MKGKQTMPPDPMAAFLELVRTAAREGTTEALVACQAALPAPSAPLLDKRALAHALCVSTASIDRLCRQKRIPFVVVGEVRRFDLEAVRAALGETREQGDRATGDRPDLARGSPGAPGAIRLLSRGMRK
jgi:hypothetical protein